LDDARRQSVGRHYEWPQRGRQLPLTELRFYGSICGRLVWHLSAPRDEYVVLGADAGEHKAAHRWSLLFGA
jgi:hypothetical protein